jgi:hypothetical protein
LGGMGYITLTKINLDNAVKAVNDNNGDDGEGGGHFYPDEYYAQDVKRQGVVRWSEVLTFRGYHARMFQEAARQRLVVQTSQPSVNDWKEGLRTHGRLQGLSGSGNRSWRMQFTPQVHEYSFIC